VVASKSTIKALSPQTWRAAATQRGSDARQYVTKPIAPERTIPLAPASAPASDGLAIHAIVGKAAKKSLRQRPFACPRDRRNIPSRLGEPGVSVSSAAFLRMKIGAVTGLAGIIAPIADAPPKELLARDDSV
jgi:hypothetical protein